MGIKLNKGVILGVASGITVFAIALLIIMFNTPDFDQQLIDQVDTGVPADKLIPQIDKETEKMNLKAKKRLTEVINKNLDKEDSISYVQSYEAEMKIISEYDNARKKFAKRKITKEQFLKDIEIPKYSMELYKE